MQVKTFEARGRKKEFGQGYFYIMFLNKADKQIFT